MIVVCIIISVPSASEQLLADMGPMVTVAVYLAVAVWQDAGGNGGLVTKTGLVGPSQEHSGVLVTVVVSTHCVLRGKASGQDVETGEGEGQDFMIGGGGQEARMGVGVWVTTIVVAIFAQEHKGEAVMVVIPAQLVGWTVGTGQDTALGEGAGVNAGQVKKESPERKD